MLSGNWSAWIQAKSGEILETFRLNAINSAFNAKLFDCLLTRLTIFWTVHLAFKVRERFVEGYKTAGTMESRWKRHEGRSPSLNINHINRKNHVPNWKLEFGTSNSCGASLSSGWSWIPTKLTNQRIDWSYQPKNSHLIGDSTLWSRQCAVQTSIFISFTTAPLAYASRANSALAFESNDSYQFGINLDGIELDRLVLASEKPIHRRKRKEVRQRTECI